MNPMARNPMSLPVIKADVIIEAPIIISNVIIIALSKVFFFISSPPKVPYVFLLPNIAENIVNKAM